MKKIIALILCFILMMIPVAGCGDTDSGDGTASPDTSPDTTPDDTASPDTTPDDTADQSATPDDGTPDAAPGGNTPGGSVEEILQQVYAGLDESFELPFLMSTPLSNDMEYGEQGIKYFIGTDEVPFVEGVASEAAIGAIPYSVALLRLEPNSDIEKAKSLIRDNVDLCKWICVGADAVVVDNVGDLVIMIMTSDEHNPGLREAIHESFLALG